jgi:hypothetical protein
MVNATIKQILKDHGVPHYERNGNIYADSMIGGTTLFERVENVTLWTRSELYAWLGY